MDGIRTSTPQLHDKPFEYVARLRKLGRINNRTLEIAGIISENHFQLTPMDFRFHNKKFEKRTGRKQKSAHSGTEVIKDYVRNMRKRGRFIYFADIAQ